MGTVGEVDFWDRGMDGTRLATVDLGKVLVRFEPQHADENGEAKALALDYHHQDDRRDALVHRIENERTIALETLALVREQNAKLRAQLPPDPPIRFFGPCCVRFDPAGKGLWLMNNQAKGWASTGFRFDSWDEVFRRYDAHVTSHGTDEHGAFWVLTNREQAKVST